MKQTLLKAVFFASILLVATSCNDDDDDNGGGTPQPSFSFTGDRTNTSTGEESTWTADAITAEVSLFDDLTIKAISGSDTLSIRVPSLQVRQYSIARDEPFGEDNGYVSVTSNDTLVYSYEFDGQDFNGGGVLSITSIDTVNMRFNAGIAGIQFFNVENGPDDNDQFLLQNAVLSNIPYTEETFDIGGGFDDDEISLTADGTALEFPILTTFISGGIITISGNSAAGFPSFTLTLPQNLTPNAYPVASQAQISGTYVNIALDQFNMTTGDLIVTSNANDRIEGTFIFTGTGQAGSVSITDGTFSVGY